MTQPVAAVRPAVRATPAWLLAAVAASLAWFTLPALGGASNEGFQATIVMNA